MGVSDMKDVIPLYFKGVAAALSVATTFGILNYINENPSILKFSNSEIIKTMRVIHLK